MSSTDISDDWPVSQDTDASDQEINSLTNEQAITQTTNQNEVPSSIPVKDFYDRWASIYDDEKDILIALDDIQLNTLLPSFLNSIPNHGYTGRRIIDMGCGTGRNMFKLTDLAPKSRIMGLDFSNNMLEVAKSRSCEQFDAASPRLQFRRLDIMAAQDQDLPHDVVAGEADAVVSTLVLEHVPLVAFFSTVARLLKIGGRALVTNLHPDKGAVSQVEFVDSESGEKVKTVSYVHGIEETVRVATECGLVIVGGVREVSADEDLVRRLGPKEQKWVGIKCWVGFIFEKETQSDAKWDIEKKSDASG